MLSPSTVNNRVEASTQNRRAAQPKRYLSLSETTRASILLRLSNTGPSRLHQIYLKTE